MGKRQVRQHPLTRAHAQGFDATGGSKGHVIETQHHTFWPAGTAGSVNNGGQLFGLTLGLALQRRILGNDIVPGFKIIGRAEGVGNAAHGIRHAGLHHVPVVQLAYKQDFTPGMVEDVVDGIGIQGGIQWHGDMAGHPDCPVGHHPLGTVLGNQADTAFFRQVKRLQVRCHPAGFVYRPAPGVLHHLAIADGLGHIEGVRHCGLPVVNHFQGKFLCCVHGPSCFVFIVFRVAFLVLSVA